MARRVAARPLGQACRRQGRQRWRCAQFNRPGADPDPLMKAIAGVSPALLALLALLPALPGGALAQEAGSAGLDEVAEELRKIREEIRVSEGETAWLYAASLGVGVAIAGIALWATRANTLHLAEQARLFRERLDLLKKDMEHRLRPVLAWCMHEKGGAIKVSSSSGRLGHLTIRVINAGQVSAADVVVRHRAMIVGANTSPGPRVRHLGALAPNQPIEVQIPMPAEDIASAMGGGMAYMEASFEYSGGGKEGMTYTVAGYKSNSIEILFGEEDASPRGQEATQQTASAPAQKDGARGAESQRIQSAGLHARNLAESQETREVMARDEAKRLLAECELAAEVDPHGPTIHRNRAAALRALGRHGEALVEIRRAEDMYRADARTLKEKARILRALGRGDEAIGALNQILVGLNDDLCAHREIARLHALRGDYGSAYASWASIVTQDPGHETRMGMAAACMAARQHGAAIVALGAVIDERPEDAYAHAQKGIAQISMGRHEEAVETLRRAVMLDPDMADAHTSLAHALRGTGRWAEAAEELDRAVRAGPGNQKAHVDRGVLMLEAGDLERAQESFEAARRLDPSMLVPRTGAAPGRPEAAQ